MSRLAWITGSGINSGSEASLACGRTTAAYKFDGSELVLVSAGNVRAGDLWHGAARIIAESGRTNYIENSDDVLLWDRNNGTDRTDTVADWSGMKRVSVATRGSAGSGARGTTNSSLSAGASILTSIIYEVGTSGLARFVARNETAGTASAAEGAVGSLSILGHGAGTISVISDELISGSRRLLVCKVVADAAGEWYIGIGPYSSTIGEDVIVYSIDVDVSDYWATHVTTGASAATYTADDLTFPNSPNWLAGKDFVAVYSYRSEAAAADLSSEVLLDLDNGTTQLTIDTTNVSCTDGTNTVSVAHAGIYAPDTDVSIVLATVGGSMIVGIAPDGGTITWAAASATYSAPTYHTELLIAPAPIAPHYIQRVGFYDGAEFATLGDAQTWAQNQETAGWPAAVQITISDTATGSDALALGAQLSVADVATGLDALSGINAALTVVDSIVGSDSVGGVQVNLTIGDTATGNDAASTLSDTLKSISDSATGADSVRVSVLATVADSATGNDVVAGVQALISVIDAANGTDVVTKIAPDQRIIGITFELREFKPTKH